MGHHQIQSIHDLHVAGVVLHQVVVGVVVWSDWFIAQDADGEVRLVLEVDQSHQLSPGVFQQSRFFIPCSFLSIVVVSVGGRGVFLVLFREFCCGFCFEVYLLPFVHFFCYFLELSCSLGVAARR